MDAGPTSSALLSRDQSPRTPMRTRLTRTAHSIMLSWGWRRAAIAWIAGAASTLALAPFNVWPILFLTFPVLVWLIDGTGGRIGGIPAAMTVGWCFGFGYFVAGLYWMGFAFLVDAKTFAWLMPLAVLGLPAALALFTGAGVALSRALWTRGPARVLALAAALTIAEWLRGHVLTGLPWNAFGYALTGPLVMAQGAALIGIWGLTFIAVAVFAAPAVLVDDRIDTPRPWLAPIAGLAILGGLGIYGAARLATTTTDFVADVRLRLMQPNLSQDAKFNYDARHEVMRRYLSLSDRATGPESQGVKDATHLIWPESAFPFFLAREPEALAQIAALLAPGTVLITGAARADESAPAGRVLRAYNSVYVIDRDGSILGIYDKVHLVPFGEYLPFGALLESFGLQNLVKQQGGFIPGDRRRLLTVPGAPPALPLVCYEIIFSGETASRGQARGGWMLNLTNDGWFGRSTGPYQHLQQARVRAIEEGLPLVRAANTGISAVIDPLGRVIGSLPLGVEGVLDAKLPKPIPPTPFVMTGDAPAAIMIALAFVVVIRRRLHGARSTES